MLTLYRKKLLHSILYFSKSVKYPSRTKIFKLLNFLDFIHFKETGRSVTNNKYYAWPQGPVPKDFWLELKNGIPEDFKDFLEIKYISLPDGKTKMDFISKGKCDLNIFTPREKRIMDELIFVYKTISPSLISEVSHLKNKPWDVTKRTKGLKAEIDYLLAIDSDAKITKDEGEFLLKDKEEFLNNYPMDAIAK